MISRQFAIEALKRCVNGTTADNYLPAQVCHNAGTSRKQLRQIAEAYQDDEEITALLNEFAFRCGAHLWQAVMRWRINFGVAQFAYRTFFPVTKNPNDKTSKKAPGQGAEAGKSGE